jgi:hypothetical protein
MNDERNQMISSAFQNAYDRIVISSQMTLRKIKQTSYEKHQFWENLIKNNSQLYIFVYQELIFSLKNSFICKKEMLKINIWIL